VVSYSPVIFYKKIKYFIESGLQFDEVVVFSDISDVQDEATSYFCIDEDPRYRKYCPSSSDEPTFGWLSNIKLLVSERIVIIGKFLFEQTSRSSWTIPGYEVGDTYAPLGVEGGIARSLNNMQALADLLAARRIPLTIVVYPWPTQIELNDRDSRQVVIWRDFCAKNCKAFIDLFPAFFALKDAEKDWYQRYFIFGDIHFSGEGHHVVFRELARRLF
jgi:hypothetical protein